MDCDEKSDVLKFFLIVYFFLLEKLYICAMINFELAREIYGLTPWMMDSYSVPVMRSILDNIRNGVSFEAPAIKANTPYIYDINSKAKLVQEDFELRSSENFEGIGLIHLNGPIMKSGGQSSRGVSEISQTMRSLSLDSRIKGFVVMTDSGGGSSAAVEIMSDTINEIKKTKPVFALIEKGGMAASAAYGIISACTKIFSESETCLVGSIGTMIQFEGRKANSEDQDGIKHIRVYATKSTSKNKGIEDALNDDNYKVIISEMLDPANERFLNLIKENRPSTSSREFDDGAIYLSKDANGWLIDGIASFTDVVGMILSGQAEDNKTTNKLNTNTNNKQMTNVEFKAAHPGVYAEAVADGIAQERDRAGAWMAHVSTDPEAVKAGIESGDEISQSKRESFFVKQNSQKTMTSMVAESAGDLLTKESTTSIETLKIEKEAEAFDFELK